MTFTQMNFMKLTTQWQFTSSMPNFIQVGRKVKKRAKFSLARVGKGSMVQCIDFHEAC